MCCGKPDKKPIVRGRSRKIKKIAPRLPKIDKPRGK